MKRCSLSSLGVSALHTQVGAQSISSACWDLCGGCRVTGIPTATLIMANYGTHKHEKVRSWFAKRPRYHVHFTPTYSSWLNQVETWFGIITRKTIRRGSFRGAKELAEKIDPFVKNYDRDSKPFVWTATTESIFEKLERLCKV